MTAPDLNSPYLNQKYVLWGVQPLLIITYVPVYVKFVNE